MSDRVHEIRVSAQAAEDLAGLRRWIVAEADGNTADAYLDRLKAHLAKLAAFPQRGTSREDLAPGLRTLSFERRLLIAYRVEDERVDILRIINGAREVGRLLRG